MVWTILDRRGRRWEGLAPREVQRIVDLLARNQEEEPGDDSNFRLWLRAVRKLETPPPLELISERVARWRAATGSIDAYYYSYIFQALYLQEHPGTSVDDVKRYLDECRSRGRGRTTSNHSFEWIGKGDGVGMLVHHTELGAWNQDADFWENTAPLARVLGRIARINGPQAGHITLETGLDAFFVPKNDYRKSRDENRRVTLYLGFSYDGLRAWDVRSDQ